MNRKGKGSEHEELIELLEELTLYHRKSGEIIHKLERKIESLEGNKKIAITRRPKIRKEYRVTKEDCEDLLGEGVRIINPGKGESDLG